LVRFAEVVRPDSGGKSDEEEARPCAAIIARRCQIVGMLVVEKHQLGTATTSIPVKKRIAMRSFGVWRRNPTERIAASTTRRSLTGRTVRETRRSYRHERLRAVLPAALHARSQPE
jgi:hypothetical protein